MSLYITEHYNLSGLPKLSQVGEGATTSPDISYH